MYNSLMTRPPTTIDVNNFNQMKHPIMINNIKIKSESAMKSYNDLYHTFTLPIVGDYSHNFALSSDYILKGINQSVINVDSLCNYIDSITLNLNNRVTILSCIDNLPRIDEITSFVDQPIIKLEFLNLPLLTKCGFDMTYMIIVKFKQAPPINYCLTYDLMFVDDLHYSDFLNHEYFSIVYMSQQPQKTCKSVELICDKGKIRINVIR